MGRALVEGSPTNSYSSPCEFLGLFHPLVISLALAGREEDILECTENVSVKSQPVVQGLPMLGLQLFLDLIP